MIGDNIKFYRKKNQLTQDDIAEACNVTRQAVSKWENGKGFPDISLLEPLAISLNISISEIIAGEIIKIQILPNTLLVIWLMLP